MARIDLPQFQTAALIVACCIGCGGGEFAGPPPGEAGRVKAVQSGKWGAASVEELRQQYEAAHRAKDMEKFHSLYLLNIGKSFSRFSKPYPEEVTIAAFFDVPIERVEFVAGEPTPPGLSAEVVYYYPEDKKKFFMHVRGDKYGKLILVDKNGKRIDPCYVVADYAGRYFLSVDPIVAEDALHSYKEGRKPHYQALPMRPPHNARNPQVGK